MIAGARDMSITAARGMLIATALLGSTVTSPEALPGQTLVPAAPGLTGGDVGLIHIEARPGSPAVALVLGLPVGSAEDPPGLEGAARVLAGAVARTVSDAVGADGVVTAVDVTPDRTRIRALVLADRWEDAWRALHEGAFGSAVDDARVAAEKVDLEEALLFASGAPVLEVRRETRILLYGAGSPQERPPGGTLDGVRALSASDAEAFRTAHYDPAGAALAVVGRLDEASARSVLGLPAAAPDTAPAGPAGAEEPGGEPTQAADTLGPAEGVAADDAPPPADAAAPDQDVPWGGAMPWDAGDRVRIAQEVTSTWIAVAYPAPADLPTTLLEALAHRLGEDLNPTPTDAGLYSARVRALPVPGGRALLIEAAVTPDAADRWEARILEVVSGLQAPAQPDFFRWQRRRLRSEILTREAAPEEAAARHADDLLAAGQVRNLTASLWLLDTETFARAARSLGPARILVYGPDLAGG